MDFSPLHYDQKLRIINPLADVGLITLWSPVQTVLKHLDRAAIDTSRIAVIGTLYGNGFPELLRNLLYNPQMHHLVLFGTDFEESRQSVINYFSKGLEEVELLGGKVHQIIGTHRKIDGDVPHTIFGGRIQVTDLGRPKDSDSQSKLKEFFSHLPPQQSNDQPRQEIAIPKIELSRFPSDPRSHSVMAESPLDAWSALLFRLYRFGHRNQLKKGERIELQNVKVVVNNPSNEPQERLQQFGISLEQLITYQKQILSSEIPEDQTYSYGNRLRSYYRPTDTLRKAVGMLRDDPDSRHVYISLWDTARDFLSGACGRPCLVSIYFRRFEERLTLTAAFRTHNALDAWLKNVYGLMAIQRIVAQEVDIPPGAITIISQSIGIDPSGGGLQRAKLIADSRPTAGGARSLWRFHGHHR